MTKLIFSIDNAADKQLMLALGRRLNLPVEELHADGLSESTFWDIISLVDPLDLASIKVATNA